MANEIKRSVTIAGHRTSISLEPEFWQGLKELACSRDLSVNELVRRIDEDRAPDAERSLSSAIRVAVLGYYRDRGACPAPEGE